MRSNFLSVAALTLASLFAAVQADGTTTWNALFTNSSGYQFLNGNMDGSKVQTQSQASVAEVAANNIKGERFSWGGNDSYVASQYHEGHFIGYDASSNEFHSDFSKTHFDALVKIVLNSNGTQASLCNSANCIGAGGAQTTDKYMWWVEQVTEA